MPSAASGYKERACVLFCSQTAAWSRDSYDLTAIIQLITVHQNHPKCHGVLELLQHGAKGAKAQHAQGHFDFGASL